MDRLRDASLLPALADLLMPLESSPGEALLVLYAGRDGMARLETQTITIAARRIRQLHDLGPHQDCALRRPLGRARQMVDDLAQRYTELTAACKGVLQTQESLLLERADGASTEREPR